MHRLIAIRHLNSVMLKQFEASDESINKENECAQPGSWQGGADHSYRNATAFDSA